MRRQTIVVAIAFCVMSGPGAATSQSQAKPNSTFVGTTPADPHLLEFLGAPPGVYTLSPLTTGPSVYSGKPPTGDVQARGLALPQQQSGGPVVDL